MEGTSTKNVMKRKLSKDKNNSRPHKKRKFSSNKPTDMNSPKSSSFKSGYIPLKSGKSYSQKNSDEGATLVKSLNTFKNSKKLKFNSKTAKTNFKNQPMTSKQLEKKAKKAKKSKISRNDLENTSEMLEAEGDFETMDEDLNECEVFSSGSESDEDNMRKEIQSSSIYQKIQKLMLKGPELNPNLENPEIVSSSLQNVEDSNAEDITDDFSDVSFNNKSANFRDDHSSLEDEEKDSKILESNLQSYSRDGSKTASKKQNILIKKLDKNVNSKIPSEETVIRNSFERNPNKKSKISKNLKTKVHEKLATAKFRFLNEKLYTETGKEAFEYFKKNNDEYEDYHLGYRQQVSKWPMNPVNEIISDLQKLKGNVVIADLGCGDAKISQVFTDKTVHSFDLVPLNEHVKACDISKVPLPNESVDVAVFCLSLMGTNLKDYLCEAFRILKVGGTLKIAEVESRIEDLQYFIKYLKIFGFALEKENTKHKMFVFLDLKKEKKKCKSGKLPNISLKPCLYKKR
ncbi:ribosomal RNA-processing protein 8 [Trichonephila clavata]|uniref:Ribosomal RNA-processing protein 8 n=1 Tax=Trichonephila clavata TaxID=2740835 RepID=A0A8X6J476_TRICU|nr:ribosomal RNA-processing protein 8 [Trichonephila clavata]